jgi:hypothetical protein
MNLNCTAVAISDGHKCVIIVRSLIQNYLFLWIGIVKKAKTPAENKMTISSDKSEIDEAGAVHEIDTIVYVNAVVRDIIASARNEATKSSDKSEIVEAGAIEVDTVCVINEAANKINTAKILSEARTLNTDGSHALAERSDELCVTLDFDDDDSQLVPDFDIERALEDLPSSSDGRRA